MANETTKKDARAPDGVEGNDGEARQGKVKRGKTRDAFAFRDFDEKRILQRPYFKKIREEYHIGDKTDEEILQSLNLIGKDSAQRIRYKAFCLQALRSSVESYLLRMSQHGTRLNKYAQDVVIKIITDENADVKIFRERYKRSRKFESKYNTPADSWSDEVSKYPGVISAIVDILLGRIIIQQEKIDGLQSYYRNIFATRLKAMREAKNLTRAELAKNLHTTQRAIGYYETAMREPNLAMLVRISTELDCSVDWLIGAHL